MANNQIKVTATLDAKSLIAGLKKSGVQLDKFEKKAEQAGKGGGRFAGGLGKISTAAGALRLGGALTAVVAFGKASFDAAARAERLGKATESLAESIGESGDSMVNAITSASGGTISELAAMEAANQAMIFGIVKSGEEMEELSTIAVRLGQAMGQDSAKSISDMTLAVGRQSKMILDNLGILISVEDANATYAATLGKSASALTDQERKQAFLNATLEAGRAKVATLGAATVGQAEKTEILSASWSNFLVGFGGVLTTVESSAGIFDGATAGLNRLTKGAEAWNKVLAEQAPLVEELRTNIDLTAGSNLAAAGTYEQMKSSMEGFQGSNDNLKAGFIATTQTFEDYNAELDRLSGINAEAKGSLASTLTTLTVSKKEWVALKNAQLQGAAASRAAGVAFGEAANKAKVEAANNKILAEASLEVNEATRLAAQGAVIYGDAIRELGPAFDAAVASSQTFADQLSFGDFGLEGGITATDDLFTQLKKQQEIAAQSIATKQQIKIDAEIDAKQIGDSIAKSVSDGLASIQGAIGQVSGLTFGEIMPPDEVFRIDEWVRRAQAVAQDMNNEWAGALQEQFGGQEFFQPVMDAFASGDQAGVTEAIQGIIAGDDIINMMDIEGAMAEAQEILAEQDLQQKINDMIMGAFAESGAAVGGEGIGAGEGLLSQVLGLGAAGEEGEGTGLTGAFDGLALAAQTAFGETIPGSIDPTTEALTDSSDIIVEMTETGLPDLESQTTSTTDAMIEKLNELKTKTDLVTNAMVTQFGKVISEAGGLVSKLGEIISELQKIKEAADAAFKALSKLPGSLGSGGGGNGGGNGNGNGGSPVSPLKELQHGGPAAAGQPVIVGEAGPELFTPNRSGFIVSNDKLGGGFGRAITQVVNIGPVFVQTNDPVQMFERIEREARSRGLRFQVAM
jgi:hypothetical protein